MPVSINIKKTELLSEDKYVLKKVTFERQNRHGKWQTHHNEVYDRGNAATILLYHAVNHTVLLVKQFRLPTYLNGNATGMMIECCAGVMEDESPEACAIREAVEETGYGVETADKIFEAYMSAGSITELVYFFTAKYEETNKVAEGGGLEEEKEDITVMELPFKKALDMIRTGEIKDAKTIMLLQYALINGLMPG